MRLTPKLKMWVFKNTELDESASDEDIKKAVGAALATDELSAEKFTQLSTTEEDTQANGLKSLLKDFGTALGEMKNLLTDEKSEKGKGKKPPQFEDDAEDEEDDDDEEEEGKKEEKPKKSVAEKSEKPKGKKTQQPSELEKMITRLSNPGAVEDGEKSLNVRVKEAAEQYSTTKSAMVFPTTTKGGAMHPLAGKPVMDYTDPGAGGRQLHNPSDLDKAVSGAFAKFQVGMALHRSKTVSFQRLPQHDKELLLYAAENMDWGGTTESDSKDGGSENIKHRRLTPNEQKALFDDATSGGLEAAPIVFDDDVITTPLLNGELYPLVNTKPVDRGRRMEGVATGTVTGTWGGIDDTAITLFNTASYVSAFDTTIFRWEGAIRIGLDFLSDSPIDFGQHVTAQYGERLLEDLDDVIATGNGTTQPEGVSVKSGTTSVNFGSAAATLSVYESLRFGVSKSEHRATVKASAVFCGSETSYQRAKAIPVGASDARRLSQTVSMPSYDDYRWMDRPYKINESLGNTKIFYAILAKYRMYRRRGLTMRTSTEGDTLLRANELLIVAMSRWGGHLERGSVCSVTSTAQA